MNRLQTLLLLLLGIGVSADSWLDVDLEKRIVGGRDCTPNERLYHVEVRAYDLGQLVTYGFCGGSLINSQWVLTAAHCWNANADMRAVVGTHPGPGTLVTVTPKFYDDPQGRRHDIMLLKLATTSRIQPIPLPQCSQRRLRVGDEIEIAGRGPTAGSCTGLRVQGRSNILQCAKTDVVACPSPGTGGHDRVKCAQRRGVDTCSGDSGGGVVFNGQIYGVHSFTCDPVRVCRAPHAFMDVCEYKDWINGVISPVKTAVKKGCKYIRNNLVCAGGDG